MASTEWRTTKKYGLRAYTLYRDESGKRRCDCARTGDPEEAEVHRLLWEARIRSRKLVKAQREREEAKLEVLTPRAALERFLAYLLSLKRSEGTIRYYRRHLGVLVRDWGDVPLQRWTPQMMRALIAAYPSWAPRRVDMVVNAGRYLHRWARLEGVACGEFTFGVETPKVHRSRGHPLTDAQLAAVLEEVRDTPYEVPVALAAFAGLALGDLRAIQWAEVDLERGVIEKPRRKTGADLFIPLAPPLRDVLLRWPGLSGPVCRELPKRDSSATQTLHRIFERAGVSKAPAGWNGWHRLRHTAATLLDAQGASMVTIGRFLGHQAGSRETTRYVTPDLERERVFMQKMADAVKAAKA